jgi:flavorubredoxin
MTQKNITKLAENVYWVGARDWNRRIFDALIPLPKGTSYNSYLIIGKNKKALIDTVNPGFEKELEEKISIITRPEEIDYIIMNHAEPDHAGAISYMMQINSKAKIVTSSKGAKMAQNFYNVSENRIIAVKDEEKIELGDKTLRFIEAPMLHWPETMFTYLQEDGILFSCDFFGAHLAGGVYDSDVEDLLVHAQRYFGEIMMPFRVMGQKALEKIKGLDIRLIAPSHGPIHKNVERILNAYKRWVDGETKRKAIIVYVTMWHSTEKMVQAIADTLSTEGIEIVVYNLALSDIGDIAKDLVDSKAIVLGAPTVLGGIHPLGVYATYLVKALRPPLKFGVVLSSYGWGGGTIKHVQELLGQTKIEVVGAVEINGPPKADDIKQIIDVGRALAKKIKEE